MAQGDVVWFDQALVDAWKKLHDISTEDIRVGLITNAVTPSKTASDPRWGSGGGTNYATNQVTPGGNYASGGQACANKSVSLSSGVAVFTFDPMSWAQHASNPANAAWGIIYNNSDAGKRCLGYIDIGGLFDMTTGPLAINPGVNGVARADQTP